LKEQKIKKPTPVSCAFAAFDKTGKGEKQINAKKLLQFILQKYIQKQSERMIIYALSFRFSSENKKNQTVP